MPIGLPYIDKIEKLKQLDEQEKAALTKSVSDKQTYTTLQPKRPQALKFKDEQNNDSTKTDRPVKIISFAEIEEKPIEWLWYPYIPLGRITMMRGDGGMGKTWMSLYIASTIAKGGSFINDSPWDVREPAKVIYQSIENNANDVIKPRLTMLSAVYENIVVIDEPGMTFTDPRIEKGIIAVRPKLAIFDPIQSYIGNIDFYKPNEIRPVLDHLTKLAEKYEMAILILEHFNKQTTQNAMNRGLGSIDIYATARSVLVVGQDPADTDRKIMAHLKANNTRHGESVAFKIDSEAGLTVEGYSDLRADDILNVPSKKGERDKPSMALEEAKEFLIEIIGKDGFIKRTDAEKMAEEKGIKQRTLYRARDELRLKTKQVGFGKSKIGWWTLPNKEPPYLPNKSPYLPNKNTYPKPDEEQENR